MHCIPAGLEDKSKKSKAERIAFDLLEYLDQINYNKYYDSMAAAGTRGGEKEKQFSDFSSQSIKAAQVSCSLKQTTSFWLCQVWIVIPQACQNCLSFVYIVCRLIAARSMQGLAMHDVIAEGQAFDYMDDAVAE